MGLGFEALCQNSTLSFFWTLTPVAQLVERVIVNHQVAGSSPAWGAFIVLAERNVMSYLICPGCGRKEEEPFYIGDECSCGDKFIQREYDPLKEGDG